MMENQLPEAKKKKAHQQLKSKRHKKPGSP
jgi:hypothetical protein